MRSRRRNVNVCFVPRQSFRIAGTCEKTHFFGNFMSFDKSDTHGSRFRLAKIEGNLAVFGNIALSAFKFFVGFSSGSLAIIADAWHTLSDSLSSVILLIGIKISEKPADAEHPFGHGRAELITAVVIGMMLAGVGFEFVRSGFEKIINRETVVFDGLDYSAMITTVIIKETMAQYAFWAAKKTGMTSLRADGYHHRSDALSSVVILAGMIATNVFGNEYFWWMDGALGTLVGIMLLRVAWVVFRDAGNKLLGEAAPEEMKTQIREIAHRVGGNADLQLHHIHLHTYGAHREITFHIRLAPETTLLDAHCFGTEIEKAIFDELGMEATIHIEPKKKADDSKKSQRTASI